MICEACDQEIEFGKVKVFGGRIVCGSCFGVFRSRSAADQSKTETTPASTNANPSIATVSPKNRFATASFYFGIASVFLYQIGIIPLLGIVLGVIGLITFKSPLQQNRWMAISGMIISLIFMIMSAAYWSDVRQKATAIQALEQMQRPANDPAVPFRLGKRRR